MLFAIYIYEYKYAIIITYLSLVGLVYTYDCIHMYSFIHVFTACTPQHSEATMVTTLN